MSYTKKQMKEVAISLIDYLKREEQEKLDRKYNLSNKQINNIAELLMEKEEHVNDAGYTINNDDELEIVSECINEYYEEEENGCC